MASCTTSCQHSADAPGNTYQHLRQTPLIPLSQSPCQTSTSDAEHGGDEGCATIAMPALALPTPASGPEEQPIPTRRPQRSLEPKSEPSPIKSKRLRRTMSNRKINLPTIMEQKLSPGADQLRNWLRDGNVRRWDPSSRSTTAWDGFRKDPELWLTGGECLVHLYARGQSRRGPSFRIPHDSIAKANFDIIFKLFDAEKPKKITRGPTKGPYSPSRASNVCDLFIPAPDDLVNDRAFDWHVTTRNFFAFCCKRPMVGGSIGQSFVALQERLHLWRPDNSRNQKDVTDYMDTMGYLEFAHCPDYALGVLQFTEYYRLKDMWIDAYAHCVGMMGMLNISTEFEKISLSSLDLIKSASRKMEDYLNWAIKTLSTFLEDDLSATHLGLSSGARAHLDRFRTFLHEFYVEKFGYWPPTRGSTFSKSLFRSMYFDFQHLYEYLVDLDSTDSLQQQKPASGGICVLQNVQAFDQRHSYFPLPHPHPLLPDQLPNIEKIQTHRTLLTFGFSSRQGKPNVDASSGNALSAATNSSDIRIVNAPLVKAYRRFERDGTRRKEEKLTASDARKVRWLLIYGTLQMLLSIIRAPPQVRDVEGPTYSLCCDTTVTPPWMANPAPELTDTVRTSAAPVGLQPDRPPSPFVPKPPQPKKKTAFEGRSGTSSRSHSIMPDCETDDYINHVELPASSWRDTFALREPSLQAFKELAKQTENDPARRLARSRSLSTSSSSASSRVSTLLLRSKSYKSDGSGTANVFPTKSTSLSRRATIIQPKLPKASRMAIAGYGNGLENAGAPHTVSGEASSTVSSSTLDEKREATKTIFDLGVGSQSSSKKDNQSQRSGHASSSETLTVLSTTPSRRTPILEPLDIDKVYDPAPTSFTGLDSPSDCPASVPLSPIFTTRSNSPSSASSDEVATPVVHLPLHSRVQQDLSKDTVKTLQLPRVDSVDPTASFMAPNEDSTITKRLKMKRRITLGGWERSLSSEKSLFPTLNSLTRKTGEKIKLQRSESQRDKKPELIKSMQRGRMAETIEAHDNDTTNMSASTTMPPALKEDAFTKQPKSTPLASSGGVESKVSGVTEVSLEKRTKDKRRRSLLLGRLGV